MASLTGLNTSESNNPPVIPNHKSASNGYSHHPSKKNQAQEGDAEGGSLVSNNPWGKGSYSDLITMALMSSPERKMKLNEIYRWITMNIPYFRNKGDEISSSGWKVQEHTVVLFLLNYSRFRITQSAEQYDV